MFQLFNKCFVENEKPHFQNCQYFVAVKFDKCSLNGAVTILLFGRWSNQEIMVSSKRGEMSLRSERNVTCWDPSHKTFAFPCVKLLSKSCPWSISLERLQCRWGCKICMILPSCRQKQTFSFSQIKVLLNRDSVCLWKSTRLTSMIVWECCKENFTTSNPADFSSSVHYILLRLVAISTASKLRFK